MKRFLTTLSAVLFVLTGLYAQSSKSPLMFDEYDWDFGKTDALNGTVCHTFTFTNKSKQDVYIDRDIPSCECIRAFYEDKIIAPGETAKAEIVLDGESFQYYDPSIDELSTKPGRYQIMYGTSSLEKDLKTIDFVVK